VKFITAFIRHSLQAAKKPADNTVFAAIPVTVAAPLAESEHSITDVDKQFPDKKSAAISLAQHTSEQQVLPDNIIDKVEMPADNSQTQSRLQVQINTDKTLENTPYKQPEQSVSYGVEQAPVADKAQKKKLQSDIEADQYNTQSRTIHSITTRHNHSDSDNKLTIAQEKNRQPEQAAAHTEEIRQSENVQTIQNPIPELINRMEKQTRIITDQQKQAVVHAVQTKKPDNQQITQDQTPDLNHSIKKPVEIKQPEPDYKQEQMAARELVFAQPQKDSYSTQKVSVDGSLQANKGSKREEIPQVRIGNINVLIEEKTTIKPKLNLAQLPARAANPFGIRGL